MATNLPFKGTPDIHSKEIYLDVEPPLVNLAWGRGWGGRGNNEQGAAELQYNCRTTATTARSISSEGCGSLANVAKGIQRTI